MTVEDIDFENFKVETERAQSIRDLISRVKNENWIGDIKTLIAEMGTENSTQNPKESQVETLNLPGFAKETASTVFQASVAENQTWSFVEQGIEIFVFKNSEAVIEATLLPKGNEYALLYISEALLPEFLEIFENSLKTFIKDAKAKKSARAASFKAKFEN